MVPFLFGFAAAAEFVIGGLWFAYGSWPALGVAHWALAAALLGLGVSQS